ncbi:MAG TPA: hypothetical protein VI318_14160 [Baekduia sp.]
MALEVADGAGLVRSAVVAGQTTLILIATCDDGNRLLPTLGRLVALPERPPIVVVDNGSAHDIAAGHRPGDVEAITLPADRGPAARMADAPAVLGFLACGVVLRRRALLATGAFEHCSRFGGEERPTALDLASAGWRLAYDPAVVVHHHPRPSERRRGAAPRDGPQRP